LQRKETPFFLKSVEKFGAFFGGVDAIANAVGVAPFRSGVIAAQVVEVAAEPLVARTATESSNLYPVSLGHPLATSKNSNPNSPEKATARRRPWLNHSG